MADRQLWQVLRRLDARRGLGTRRPAGRDGERTGVDEPRNDVRPRPARGARPRRARCDFHRPVRQGRGDIQRKGYVAGPSASTALMTTSGIASVIKRSTNFTRTRRRSARPQPMPQNGGNRPAAAAWSARGKMVRGTRPTLSRDGAVRHRTRLETWLNAAVGGPRPLLERSTGGCESRAASSRFSHATMISSVDSQRQAVRQRDSGLAERAYASAA